MFFVLKKREPQDDFTDREIRDVAGGFSSRKDTITFLTCEPYRASTIDTRLHSQMYRLLLQNEPARR